MNWWERPIWALDLETTGVDPHTAEVVQFAVARVTPSGRVLEQHSGVIRTEGWGEGAESVHGITRSESAIGMHRERMVDEIRAGLYRAFGNREPLVVFNAAYDLTILARYRAFPAAGTPAVLDPLVLDKQAHKYRRGSRKLGAVYAHYYGEVLNGAHDALADAVAAARVAFALAERHPTLQRPAAELHDLQVRWAGEQAASLQAHFRKTNPAAVVDGSWPVGTP